MIHHTIIFSFEESVPPGELERFLAEVRELMLGPGQATSFEAARTITVASDAHAPVMVSSAIAQMAFSDDTALEAASNLPELRQFVEREQRAHPYRLVWANHEPLPSGPDRHEPAGRDAAGRSDPLRSIEPHLGELSVQSLPAEMLRSHPGSPQATDGVHDGPGGED